MLRAGSNRDERPPAARAPRRSSRTERRFGRTRTGRRQGSRVVSFFAAGNGAPKEIQRTRARYMPTILSHPAVPLALALGLGRKTVPPRLAQIGVVASILPDLDVLAFA